MIPGRGRSFLLPRSCGRCRHTNVAGAVYCAMCGRMLDAASEPPLAADSFLINTRAGRSVDMWADGVSWGLAICGMLVLVGALTGVLARVVGS